MGEISDVERVLPLAEVDTQPEDLSVLRAFLGKLLADGETEKTMDVVLLLVARLLREQARLNGKLATLLRVHAESGSEKIGAEQLRLWMDALTETSGVDPTEDSSEKGENPKPRGSPKRKGFPEGLERRHIPLPVEGPLRICAIYGAEKTCIGHEKSEIGRAHV